MRRHLDWSSHHLVAGQDRADTTHPDLSHAIPPKATERPLSEPTDPMVAPETSAKEWGAHSLRIGGATDLAAAGASPLLLQAKGRWSSDIGRIYSRMTRKCQLAASKLMHKAHSCTHEN